MAGVLLQYGQNHIANVLFEATAVQNYYLALLVDTEVLETDQIGAGLTEVVGTDYARILLTRGTDWTLVASAATCAQKEFTVGAGGWVTVNAYAVCLSGTPTTADAIWAEVFPVPDQGDKSAGNKIQITPKFTMKDDAE